MAETQAATHEVIRRLSAGGRTYLAGDTVDATDWRWRRSLEEQRFIRPIAGTHVPVANAASAPKSGAENPEPLVEPDAHGKEPEHDVSSEEPPEPSEAEGADEAEGASEAEGATKVERAEDGRFRKADRQS